MTGAVRRSGRRITSTRFGVLLGACMATVVVAQTPPRSAPSNVPTGTNANATVTGANTIGTGANTTVNGANAAVTSANSTITTANVPKESARATGLGATTVPVTASAIERTTIARPTPTTNGSAVKSATVQKTTNLSDFSRVFLALGAVVAVIFLLRWLARRMFPSVGGMQSGRVVQVLSRSVLAPKQQVMVMKVGRRLLVVGDTGSNMNTLCEITDPDEVAILIGQVQQEQKGSITSSFSTLFGRASKAFDPDGGTNDRLSDEPVTDGRLTDGRSTGARGVTSDARSDRSHDFSASLNPPRAASHEAVARQEQVSAQDLDTTRQEIAGLMDRARLLARQFGRS